MSKTLWQGEARALESRIKALEDRLSELLNDFDRYADLIDDHVLAFKDFVDTMEEKLESLEKEH